MDQIVINSVDETVINIAEELGSDSKWQHNSIPFVGRHNSFAMHPKKEEHYENHGKIYYLEKGVQTVFIEGEKYVMKSRDILVVHPGERHSIGGVPEERSLLYWIVFDYRANRPAEQRLFQLPLPYKDDKIAQLIEEGLSKRLFPGNRIVRFCLQRLFRVYGNRDDPFRNVKIYFTLLELVIEVISSGQSNAHIKPDVRIRDTLDIISSNVTEHITIQALAAKAFMSESYFKHSFKQETGYTPRDYINKTKIEEAKRLLIEKRLTMTETSSQLGFSSSQYFSVTFKKYVGETPLKWVKQTLEEERK